MTTFQSSVSGCRFDFRKPPSKDDVAHGRRLIEHARALARKQREHPPKPVVPDNSWLPSPDEVRAMAAKFCR